MRRGVLWGLVLLLAAALSPQQTEQAFAQTPADAGLVSNLGQTRYQYPSFTTWQFRIADSDHGQRFTTGGNAGGYRVDSVDIELANLSDTTTFSKITVMLAGQTLTPPAFVATTAPRMYRFTAPAGGIDLLPSTTYTIMIDTTAQPSGTGEVVLTRSTALDDGSASGWTIGQRLNRRWDRGNWSNVSDRIKMRVNGEPNPALVGTLSQPNGQDAPTLVANIGEADGATGSLGDDRAQAFTTGGTGLTLSAVEVLFASYRDSSLHTKVAATIRTDSSGSPGSEVGALTVPANQSHTTQTTLALMAPAAGISLAANTTYWLVFDSSAAPTLPVNIRYTASDAEDADGESGWTIADGSLSRSRSATDWTGSTSNAESMKIRLIGSSFDLDLAQAFTTGGHEDGYTVDSVDVQLSRLDDSGFFTKVAVAIASDSSGSPGTSLGTLTTSHSGTFTSDRVITLAASAGGIDLEPNTTYWLVFDVQQAPSGTNNVRDTASDAEDAGGLPGWSIGDDVHSRNRDDTGGWSSDPATLKIRVNGTERELIKSFANDQAQAFTTGSNPTGYTLNSIDVQFADLSDGAFASKVDAEIHTNPDHVRKHAVGILTIPSVENCDSGCDVTLTAPEGGIRLKPNTTYWLLLDVRVRIPNGDNAVRYTRAAAEDAEYPRARGGFTVADSSRWKYFHHPRWTTSGDSMNIRINGTARGAEPPRAFVPVVVGNLGQADTPPESGLRSASSLFQGDITQAFTTGGSGAGYTLRRVDVQFRALNDADFLSQQLTVTVARDSGGLPGATVGTLTNPADTTFSSPTVLTFATPAAGIDLKPNTVYWLVLDTSGSVGDFDFGAAGMFVESSQSHAEDANAAPGWAVGDHFVTRSNFGSSPWSPLVLPPGEEPPSLKVRFHASQRPQAAQQAATLFTPGHEAIYMREGGTATLGLTLAQELTAGSGAVTVTSSDASVVKVNVPQWLVMGFDRADCPPGGTSSRCLKGRVVQRTLERIERSPLREVHRQPSASMQFGFDERDWAGYASQVPFRWPHKGWREVKVSAERLTTHGQPGVDFGADRVFDLSFSHADSSVSLPDPVKVVVSRGSGLLDPTFDPDVSEFNCRFFDCLTVAEGGTAAYTITNRIAPRPGRPLRITPTLVEGSGVTFSPAYVEWATVQDYIDNPTKTITVNAVDDNVYTKGRAVIRHVFNTHWDTNGWLSKRLQVPKTYTIDGNTHTFVVSREAAMSQFNMVVKVTQDEDPPMKLGSPEQDSDARRGIEGTGTQQGSLMGYMAAPDVVVKVMELASQSQHGTAHVNRWSRVLVAFGVLDGDGVAGGAMTADEAQDMADAHSSPVWDEVVTELTALEASQASQSQDEQTTPTPELSITAGSGITEGETATFTITANPAPTSPITVKVSLSETGNFGATGAATVTVTGATTTYTVTTTDDDADEPDGSVKAVLKDGDGYTVSSTNAAATVSVADNDDAPASYTVDPAVVNKVRALAAQTLHGTDHVNRWNRVLVAFGEHDGTGVTDGAMTADEAQDMADAHSSPVWGEVVTELTALEAWQASQSQDRDEQITPTPELSISAGSGITEGGTATFTITASPAPSSPITVNVGVSESGSFGATGAATVTVSGATTTYTVTTTDDSVDEADGSVTATLQDGSGYTVSSTNAAATVSVADNDDAPAITPVVSISAGSGITEGGAASFTITASPAPSSPITVNVGVSESGSFGATGAATVTVSGASTTYTISTTDDSVDEADGSVTATLQDGSGYTVSSTNAAATVSVADDDAPVITPVVSISAGSGITEGGSATFTITASPAPSSPITVKVGVSESGNYGATGAATVTVSGASTTYTVTTTDDSVDEADGSVTATLQDGSGYTVSSTNAAATVSVADNDDAAPEVETTLTVEEASASEGDEYLEFTVRLSQASTEEITIAWNTATAWDVADNRAHGGDDYEEVFKSELVFAAGVTEMTGRVRLIQDGEAEEDEHFAIELFLPDTAWPADATVIMTIEDGD